MSPAIIAHRGLRSVYPENTLPAVKAALALPLAGVEFDAQLTADHQVVIVHQETVEPDESFQRLRLAPRKSGRCWVEETVAAKIKVLDAGSWLDNAFSSVKVPLLSELLAVSWNQKRAYLELKDSHFLRSRDGDSFVTCFVDALSPSVEQFLEQGGLLSFVSFQTELLNAVGSRFPQQQRVLDIWFDRRGKYQEVFDALAQCRAETLCLPDVLLLEDPSWLARCRDKGIQCFTYPVSPAKGEDTWNAAASVAIWEQLYSLKVDGIITDFATELCAWMSR
jgi:glycerophosphoryl diester phosphodiesterase